MKILLAEDDTSIQTIAHMALARVGGHVVRCTDNGEQTLKATQEALPELIILDVMMPKLNGFETCQRLKQNPRTKNIPVIFLTAKAQLAEIQKGIGLGAIGYILKPFDPMTLAIRIQEILEKTGESANAA